jgi:hypothetical protein
MQDAYEVLLSASGQSEGRAKGVVARDIVILGQEQEV